MSDCGDAGWMDWDGTWTGHGQAENSPGILFGHQRMKIHLHFCISLGSQLQWGANQQNTRIYIHASYRQTPMGRTKIQLLVFVLIESLARTRIYYLIPWASLSRPNRRVFCLTYCYGDISSFCRILLLPYRCFSPSGFPACILRISNRPRGKAPNFVISKQEGPDRKGKVINCDRYEAKGRDMDCLPVGDTPADSKHMEEEEKLPR